MAHGQWLAPAVAVGISLSLTAACGSDSDSGGGGAAGSGAAAGASGSGGSSGSGTGGTAGGSGGSSASGGTAGSGGSGGATGGSGGVTGIATDANLRVAFIGDSGNGSNFQSVLDLIKSENADFVLHQGDFDYSNNPDGFFKRITDTLGANYPYFASVGNHDVGSWSGYVTHIKQRMADNNVTPDDPDLSDQKYALEFRGLKVVFVGEDGNNSEYATFLNDQLTGDDHIWKVCSWHKNQKKMQVGGKSDEMGWDVYENCRKLGGIVATGHEHSYERTKTLSNMQTQTVDGTCSDPNALCVGPGRTFAFVSGLGGQSIRPQLLCLPATYPYGCNQEWGFIYTSNQNAKYGALFIDFNVGGDAKKAHGYFKTIDNQTVDEFDIVKD